MSIFHLGVLTAFQNVLPVFFSLNSHSQRVCGKGTVVVEGHLKQECAGESQVVSGLVLFTCKVRRSRKKHVMMNHNKTDVG